MGRVRVTPKGKVKKNIAITRIGKKQYLKRRFAPNRQVEIAGSDNRFTKKYFDKKGTVAQNFSRLGLCDNPSLRRRHATDKKPARPRRRLEEEKELEEDKAIRKACAIGSPVSEAEGVTMGNLINKYGTDFKAMSFDRKLNPYQLNPRQLQKQVVNYLRWEKAAFPKAFAEAEAKGWLSIEEYADPKNRIRKK
ncbi:putative Ribosome biogenesis protein Nop16 [Trypanosoma vivax]|uniref:Nucleolar protein 16 n=1 Tax=Trypanosoma vivax (strain Y486) TaxID=1055687 RepID=G0U105_TRYVY|nr:hypothetical protein TRVL_00773 [Trypanosoma vivax]KAH8608074.1 putative Ribosome biogenesis protein Nop16 [Trypanosoma vivax]CCC49760.1 conserved hypothetical protein [Trypanosoma vivax Y486]